MSDPGFVAFASCMGIVLLYGLLLVFGTGWVVREQQNMMDVFTTKPEDITGDPKHDAGPQLR